MRVRAYGLLGGKEESKRPKARGADLGRGKAKRPIQPATPSTPPSNGGRVPKFHREMRPCCAGQARWPRHSRVHERSLLCHRCGPCPRGTTAGTTHRVGRIDQDKLFRPVFLAYCTNSTLFPTQDVVLHKTVPHRHWAFARYVQRNRSTLPTLSSRAPGHSLEGALSIGTRDPENNAKARTDGGTRTKGEGLTVG